jgi:Planctomycete cytochrome C
MVGTKSKNDTYLGDAKPNSIMANLFQRKNLVWIAVAASVAFVFYRYSFGKHGGVDYNTEVKPILNKHCLSCHGGVRRKEGFSLLTREDALAPTDSGKPAIVPGHPERSEFIRRLTLHDPEERMPYKKEPLTKDEIVILTKWVDEGANWDTHWAKKGGGAMK